MTYHPMRLLFVGRPTPSLLFVGRARGARGRGSESTLKTWWQRSWARVQWSSWDWQKRRCMAACSDSPSKRM
jgi:hypothetical protein